MKFVREPQSPVTIRHVEKGKIRIGEETVTENVLLFRNAVRRGCFVGNGEQLTEEDLAELIEEGPEIILLGTGWRPRLPPRELVFALARRGIGFETMDTPAACRTFNILVSEDRDVAAVLLID